MCRDGRGVLNSAHASKPVLSQLLHSALMARNWGTANALFKTYDWLAFHNDVFRLPELLRRMGEARDNDRRHVEMVLAALKACKGNAFTAAVKAQPGRSWQEMLTLTRVRHICACMA